MKNKNLKRFLPYLLFIIGVLIALYPFISQQFYTITSNRDINNYKKAIEELNLEEINKKLKLAKDYNNTLDPSRIADPFSADEKVARAEYARMLEIQEKLGYVEIPKINQKLPIYAGTSEEVLRKGAGHLEGTSLPVGGKSTHSVITAHRGLPEARLFTDLDQMQEGDIFYIHILNQVLAYEVDQILVVEPTDFDPILVVEGKDYATLLTCTPYSINTHRLLVRGYRIDYKTPVKETDTRYIIRNEYYKYYLILSVLVILILIYFIQKYIRTLRELRGKFKDNNYEK